jgi:hypothetical protein
MPVAGASRAWQSAFYPRCEIGDKGRHSVVAQSFARVIQSNMNTPHNILSGSVAALLRKSHLVIAAASLCFAATGHSQNITFGAATTIAGDADVFTIYRTLRRP